MKKTKKQRILDESKARVLCPKCKTGVIKKIKRDPCGWIHIKCISSDCGHVDGYQEGTLEEVI